MTREDLRPRTDLAPELDPLEAILRAALVCLLVQVVFRPAGRKALQRWGAPEFVLLFLVTVAMQRSIVVDDESVTTALLALATIAGLDRIATTPTARSERAADLIEGAVVQLVRDGRLDREAMAKVRTGEHELLARVREKGREAGRGPRRVLRAVRPGHDRLQGVS